jgi:nucleoside-diphosphate-sugar epimerase
MHNIILTGVNSFLGNHFIQEFKKSYYINCLVRPNSKRAKHSNIKYCEVDFLNPIFNKSMFNNIFAVIHILSIKSSNHPDIFRINVDFTKKLVEAALLYRVQKFIYISSESVQLPGEDCYTKSKKKAEKEVAIHNNHLILRPTVIYGKKNTSDIGFLIALIKRIPIVPIVGNGKQLIQPVSVDDVVKCIDSGLLHNISGIHLIAGQNSLKYREIIKVISMALGKNTMVIRMPFAIGYIIAKFLALLKLRFLEKSQIDNLKINRVYSMDETEKIFRLKFSDPKEGIYRIAK